MTVSCFLEGGPDRVKVVPLVSRARDGKVPVVLHVEKGLEGVYAHFLSLSDLKAFCTLVALKVDLAMQEDAAHDENAVKTA